jgi:hypothetical protein
MHIYAYTCSHLLCHVHACLRAHQVCRRIADVLPDFAVDEHDDSCGSTGGDEDMEVEGDDDGGYPHTLSVPQGFGGWEQHTKGIGSKLMEQMGYVRGTGLGRDKSGRVEPVPVVVLPPGKSLDYAMDRRNKVAAKRKRGRGGNAQGRCGCHV